MPRGAGAYLYLHRAPAALVLTGIVTTNDVIVSPQIGGQIEQLLVKEGDAVKKDQLVAVIVPDELRADTAYYTHNVAGLSSQVQESEAALRFQQRQTADQIRQAESTLAASEAQVAPRPPISRTPGSSTRAPQNLSKQGVVSPQELDQARTAASAAQAKLDALKKQVDAQRATVALARSNAEQTAVRRSQVQANEHLKAAATAQRTKADVRLRYTELHAPIDGIVDVRAVRVGEVVNPGQPVVTLINPDDLWVRVDVEESYIDRVRIGDKLTVRLPSGVERDGHRVLSRRRRVVRDAARRQPHEARHQDVRGAAARGQPDRRLAVGMTAYVVLPIS